MDEITYSYNNNNITLVKVKVANQPYNIMGFSRAGMITWIAILELNLVFDMGQFCIRTAPYDNIFISHGHYDHIGGLPGHHCGRRLHNIYKEKMYVMPKQCIGPFKMIASAFSEMNCGKPGNHIKMIELVDTKLLLSESCADIKPVLHNNNIFFKAIHMDHKITSFGYMLYRMSKKLKQEYVGLVKEEIIKIKKEIGANMTETVYTPLVGYTGDTSIKAVLENECFLTVPLLIMECTGFAPDDINTTCEGKHIHWNDIISNHTKFKNEKIILFHFSQQYKTMDDIQEYIKDMPESMVEKIIFFI